jgi:hypothetical protein
VNIKLDQFEFFISVLSEFGVVIPSQFDVQDQKNGFRAIAQEGFLFGDPRRPYSGDIAFELNRTVSNGVQWSCTAKMQHNIKGIKVRVEPISGIALVEAGGNLVEIEEDKVYTTVFPMGWYPAARLPQSGKLPVGENSAQHIFIQGPDSLYMLSSDDYPPRFQRYWAFRDGDQISLTIYLEANVSNRQGKMSTPNWILEPVANYETGIQQHKKWMQEAYGLKPIGQRTDAPDWIKDICLNITFHCHANHGRVNVAFSDIEEILEKTAKYFDPAHTQLHVVGWDGPWDWTWPAFQPGEELGGVKGFHQMMRTVHRLGYKIGLHMNVMGFSYRHPQFDELKHFLQYQCRDSANRPLNWEYDLDGDDQDDLIFAYISPDEPEWRSYLVEQITNFVDEFRIDIVHLDQSTTIINDYNYDHWRGLNALNRELRETLPSQVALSGEGVSEVVAHLYPLCGMYPLNKPEIQGSLYTPYVRAFNYGLPPEPTRESLQYDAFERGMWKSESFYKDLRMAEKAGFVPTLLVGKPDIRLDSEEASSVFAAARRFKERVNVI